ncbi:MAG: hypothetical protein HY254_14290 [Burkholderiales bacterium]|nr:hypothetical protein [Burkholderiales bacterium]
MLASFALLAMLSFQSSTQARVDESFYFPSKVMAKAEGLNFDNLSFKVGNHGGAFNWRHIYTHQQGKTGAENTRLTWG